MMRVSPFSGALLMFVGASAAAQESEPSAMMIAQAQDRCMATYAVRLSKESQDDEAIYEAAKSNCAELDAKLIEAIDRELPAEAAQKIKTEMAEQAKPRFLAMLAKIRADRASRASQ